MARISKGNPYTHSASTRDSSAGRGSECAWCGRKAKTLYSYNGSRKKFCSKSCYKSYST